MNWTWVRVVWVALLLGILNQLCGQSNPLYFHPDWPIGPKTSIQTLTDQMYAAFPVLEKTGATLNLIQDLTTPGGRHLSFEQQFDSLPVCKGGMKVHLSKFGELISVSSFLQDYSLTQPLNFLYDTSILIESIVARTQAQSIRLNALYYVDNGQLIPAYQLFTKAIGEGADYEIIVDARDGRQISMVDAGAYFRPQQMMDVDTSGYGLIYWPDPCTKANVPYGALFVDNNDTSSVLLDALRDTVRLQNITYDSDSGYFLLEGPNVVLRDISHFAIEPVHSVDGTFYFDRSHHGFEEVMVYFHIDSFHRYVERLGYGYQYDGKPIQADAHGFGNSDNSAFQGNGGEPYLKFGDGGVDDAEDADVIVHEYVHALSYAASPETNKGTERKGIDEGIADYFAAIYSRNINTYGWQNLFNWDGHNEFWEGRTVNSVQEYNPELPNIHDYGGIWVSAMLGIESEIGTGPTDTLLLEFLAYTYRDMTLPEAVEILLDIDSMLFQEANRAEIVFHFCQKKVPIVGECVFVHNNPALPAIEWSIDPNPNNGEFRVFWPGDHGSTSCYLECLDIHGRKVFEQFLYPGLNVAETKLANGMYFCRIKSGDEYLQTRKILIQRP